MLTARQFAAFTPKRRGEIRCMYAFFPRNRHGVQSGYYRDADIVPLLRRHYRNAETVLFIAHTLRKER
jgi:hypothetical protein